MENNWREKAKRLAMVYLDYTENSIELDNCITAILKGMDLVFEATKKECADRSEIKPNEYIGKLTVDESYFEIDKESILNINKPNLSYI